MVLTRVYRQAKIENKEIANLLEENKAEVDFLIETYNGYKELLDQHQLTKDLEQLLVCVHCRGLQVNDNLSLLCRKMTELHDFLVKSQDKKPNRKLHSLKAVWEAGDLKFELEALNRGIAHIRTHWKVWKCPSETPARLEGMTKWYTGTHCYPNTFPSFKVNDRNNGPIRPPGPNADQHGLVACGDDSSGSYRGDQSDPAYNC
jgi:hypothetical protein